MPGPLDTFRELADDHGYEPEPTHPFVRHMEKIQTRELSIEPDWDKNPLTRRVYKVGGEDREFFTLGALAEALGRSQQTIRSWESRNVIPLAPAKKAGLEKDKRGNRRLYTREHISGLLKIAGEEGLLNNDFRAINKTEFSKRAHELFKDLRG